jgi:hypothetical protein
MSQEAGKPARSIAARLLQNREEQEANYREQYWALGALYLAGSDTQNISSQILMYARLLIHLSLQYLDVDALLQYGTSYPPPHLCQMPGRS